MLTGNANFELNNPKNSIELGDKLIIQCTVENFLHNNKE